MTLPRSRIVSTRFGAAAGLLRNDGPMLRGPGQKDIAAARNTSRTTIRHQAQAIYRKSGRSGRTMVPARVPKDLFDRATGQAGTAPAPLTRPAA